MTPRQPRSLLFIPASRPDFAAKAHLTGADAIILDLEDAVPLADKAAARLALPSLHAGLLAHGLSAWVRINALDKGGEEDLKAIAALPGAPVVMLPKVETPQQASAACAVLRAHGERVRVALLIETPAGVIRAADLATADEGICALAFGSEDFAAALGVAPSPAALAMPAQWVVLAAAAQGLPAFGLPGSLADFADLEGLAHVGEHAASLGFSGALCIHPAQVAVLNRCFSPTPKDIAWAERVLAQAAVQTGGASAVDGRMIDPPVLARAQRIMDRAKR
jgi:citrate lyase subunit beta/citryl-CoA lyase